MMMSSLLSFMCTVQIIIITYHHFEVFLYMPYTLSRDVASGERGETALRNVVLDSKEICDVFVIVNRGDQNYNPIKRSLLYFVYFIVYIHIRKLP